MTRVLISFDDHSACLSTARSCSERQRCVAVPKIIKSDFSSSVEKAVSLLRPAGRRQLCRVQSDEALSVTLFFFPTRTACFLPKVGAPPSICDCVSVFVCACVFVYYCKVRMCLQTHLLPCVCFEIWRQLWQIIQTFTHLRFTGEESGVLLSEGVGGDRYGYCTLHITVMRKHTNIIWQKHLSFFLI